MFESSRIAVGFSFPTARHSYLAAASLLRGWVFPFRRSSAIASSAAPFSGLSSEAGSSFPASAGVLSIGGLRFSTAGGAVAGAGAVVLGWSEDDARGETGGGSVGFSVGAFSAALGATGGADTFGVSVALGVVLAGGCPVVFCGRDCA